ncbi:hypothetical protein AA14337_0869 [Acetobacter malorum DSM 14337]|uniref:Uncharacterized protein n=1 Tax=Acetobacter malorum DSM 14337 TaxID=1307910 RepID=A0ABQ0PPN4_9PROT|nr:hypothetical protein AA14337_0869 [Acetobacter malorum DSM 14337]
MRRIPGKQRRQWLPVLYMLTRHDIQRHDAPGDGCQNGHLPGRFRYNGTGDRQGILRDNNLYGLNLQPLPQGRALRHGPAAILPYDKRCFLRPCRGICQTQDSTKKAKHATTRTQLRGKHPSGSHHATLHGRSEK